MDQEQRDRILAGIVSANPKLQRNKVFCHLCGHSETVNSLVCMREGWPKHCGVQMSIDSPQERSDILTRNKKPKTLKKGA